MKTVFSSIILIGFIFLISWQQPSVPKAIMDRGKVVYDKACLSCHMPNGLGVPRMAPTLSKSKYVLGTKTKMIRIVLRGSDEIPTGADSEFTNPMAPILNLTDQQLADVLTFVRNSYGNRATVVTAVDVKYVKARMK